jgi:hypothetical protein
MDALRKPEFPPRFKSNESETPSVEISQFEYMEFLVNGGVTEPKRWPSGKEKGATLLARIREIEQDCIREHGKWDWELIASEL